MNSPRTMLSFRTGRDRFNYRVAAVALHEGHVLVCREDDDDYVMLPGGRVEFGEASAAALVREIGEELRCVGQVERLLFTAENFFERGGELFHEIALYYAVSLPRDFPFVRGATCLATEDEGHALTFEWVEADAARLSQWNLLPEWMRRRLAVLPDAPEHVIIDERPHD